MSSTQALDRPLGVVVWATGTPASSWSASGRPRGPRPGAVPQVREQLETRTPLGRVGEAEDVAAAVVCLASRAGRYVTGKMLEVDGGIQAPNLDLGLPDL